MLQRGYFTDLLLRPQDAAERAQSDDAAATAEVSCILMQGAERRGSGSRCAYVATIVAPRAGVPQEEAVRAWTRCCSKSRTRRMQPFRPQVRRGNRPPVASAAAALGGWQRDDDEAALVVQA